MTIIRARIENRRMMHPQDILLSALSRGDRAIGCSEGAQCSLRNTAGGRPSALAKRLLRRAGVFQDDHYVFVTAASRYGKGRGPIFPCRIWASPGR